MNQVGNCRLEGIKLIISMTAGVSENPPFIRGKVSNGLMVSLLQRMTMKG